MYIQIQYYGMEGLDGRVLDKYIFPDKEEVIGWENFEKRFIEKYVNLGKKKIDLCFLLHDATIEKARILDRNKENLLAKLKRTNQN